MPPYSDNLYSAEDGGDDDGESFSDELSPTDGYFNPNGVPSTVMVPDPSLDYGPPEDKTLIPPPGSQAGTGRGSSMASHHGLPQISRPHSAASPPAPSDGSSGSPTQYTPSSPASSRRRDLSFSEHDGFLFNPPPAYSESPPQSVHSSSVSGEARAGANYSTFSATQLERGFLPHRREPESMGGPVDNEASESTPLISARSIIYSPRRRKVKALLFAALVFAVITTTLSIVFGCERGDPFNPPSSNSSYCAPATFHRERAVYEMSTGRDLTIIQKAHGEFERGSRVSTEGEIRLRKAPANSEHGSNPYITIDMGATVDISPIITWSEDSQTLEVSTPRYISGGPLRSECLYAIITAWLPEGSEFTNLRFDAQTLNMALSDVHANITERSKFTTVAGEAWLDTGYIAKVGTLDLKHHATSSKPRFYNSTTQLDLDFQSRRITIETATGPITGTYPLLDELVLSSQSGEITVQVSPQPASKSVPAPADLEVQTGTGAIHVDFPFGPAPLFRDYITRVHSNTGVINGNYYLGSESNFKTTSGTINITAQPVLPTSDDEKTKVLPNTFETHTLTGLTTVVVLDPIFFTPPLVPKSEPSYTPVGDKDPYLLVPPNTASSTDEPDPKTSKLRSLRSAHSSNVGEVTVKYPNAWQGGVHAKTVTGGIRIRGEGFRTVKEKNGIAFKEVLKRRGVDGAGEGCLVDLSNISGAVELTI